MSRRKLKARGKKIQKMSRDGVVEINAVTGGEKSISKREADFHIQSSKPERETLSQVGTRLDVRPSNTKKTMRRYSEALRETPNPQRQSDTSGVTEQKSTEPTRNAPDIIQHQTADAPSVNPRDPPMKTDGVINHESTALFEDNAVNPVYTMPSDKTSGKGKLKTRSNEAYQERHSTAIRQDSDVSPLHHQSENLTFSENSTERPVLPKQNNDKHTKKRKKSKYRQKQSSFIQYELPKSDSTLIQGKEAVPSAAATVVPPDNEGKFRIQRETVLQYNQAELKTDLQPLLFETLKTEQPEGGQTGDTADIPHDIPQTRPLAPSDTPRRSVIRQVTKGKIKQNRDTVYRHNKPVVLQNEPQKPDLPISYKHETAQTEILETSVIPQTTAETTDNSAVQPQSSERDVMADNEGVAEGQQSIKGDKPNSLIKQDKSGKLKFSEDEAAPDKKPNRKLEKAERQVEQTGKKLEKAQNKLPSKRKLRSERVFDEQKGKATRKLHFEKEVKSQGQHLKGALPLRPVKAGTNALMLKAHSKIYGR